MTKIEMINTILTCSNITGKTRERITRRAMRKDKLSITLIYYGYCTRERMEDDIKFITLLAQ